MVFQVFNGFVEKTVADMQLFPAQTSIQFERLGFFTRDGTTLPELVDSNEKQDVPVFNLTVSLQESFTAGDDLGKEKAKQQDKLAREKAALERQRKKEEKEARKKAKEIQALGA